MPYSFFQLTPAMTAPPVPDAYEASLAKAAHDALLDEAMALGDTLSEAIDLYAESHPELSYSTILEALRYLFWCTRREMNEENADA